jgi:hypothetical protein
MLLGVAMPVLTAWLPFVLPRFVRWAMAALIFGA